MARTGRKVFSGGVAAIVCAATLVVSNAQAQVDGGSPASDSPDSDEAAFVASGKIGGIMSFNGLNPFVVGGVQLGWIFGGTNQRMAALLDVTYTAPSADGKQTDERLEYDEASGEYSWSIVQKELVFQPTFVYRFTSQSKLVPFVGLGPRIYLLQTTGEGEANGEKILQSTEQSMKFGAGLPFGAEYTLGPGGVFAEALLEWAPLDHRITGDTSLLAANLFLGYRARF